MASFCRKKLKMLQGYKHYVKAVSMVVLDVANFMGYSKEDDCNVFITKVVSQEAPKKCYDLIAVDVKEDYIVGYRDMDLTLPYKERQGDVQHRSQAQGQSPCQVLTPNFSGAIRANSPDTS